MRHAAFTMVELILVMALMVVLLAILAPLLSKSMRGRGLLEEARRYLSLTEFARSEAVSQGVPTTVWIEPSSSRYGVETKAGSENLTQGSRPRAFTVAPQIRMEVPKSVSLAGGRIAAADFASNGALSVTSVETVKFADRHGESVTVARMHDGWGYEIVKNAK